MRLQSTPTPPQGRFGSVMLLTPTAGPREDVLQTVEDQQAGIGELRFTGGTGAISNDVRDALEERTIDPE